MNETSEVGRMSAEVQSRLDSYLDAVEAALARAGKAREARRAITDDLEGQLREMLAERTRGRPPTREDVEAMLATADSPEAYADASFVEAQRRTTGSPGHVSEKRRRSRVMRMVFVTALVVCGTLLVMTPAGSDYLQQRLLVHVLESRPDFTSVSGAERLPDMERFGCWLTGSLMILVGIVAGLRARASQRHE